MARKTLVFEVGADYDERGLKDAKGDIKDIAKELANAQKAGGDRVRLEVDIDVDVKGDAKILGLTKGTEALDKAVQKNEQSIRQQTKAQEGSVASAKGRLQQAQQELSYLRAGSSAYNAQVQTIEKLQRAYDTSRGIQQGSLTVLQREGKVLQDQLRDKSNYRTELQKLQNQIIENNAEQRRAQGIQKDSLADLKASRNELIALRDATNQSTDSSRWNDLSREIDKTEKQISALAPATLKFTTLLDNIQRIRATVDTVNQAFQILNRTIGIFVNRQKQIEGFGLALRNIGLSANEVAVAFSQAEATATSLGAPLQTVERSYKRILPSLRGLGLSASESDTFIKNLAARTQTLGLSAEEASRYTEAFAQVLSKGKLQGEELNQQISELDGSFRNQFAGALSISTAEFNKLVEAGGVGSIKFVRAFNSMQNGAEALEEGLREGNATIQQLQNNIATLNTKNIEAIGTAFQPLIRAILEVTQGTLQFINALSRTQVLGEIGKAVGGLVKGFGQFGAIIKTIAKVLLPIVDTVLAAVAAFLNFEVAGVSLAQVLGFLAGALAFLATKFVISKLVQALTGSLGKLIQASSGLKTILGTLGPAFLKVFQARTIAQAATAFRGLTASLFGVSKGFGAAAGGAGVFNKALLGLLANPYVLAFAGFAVVAYKVSQNLNAGADAARDFDKIVKNLQKSIKNLNKELGDTPDTEEAFKKGPVEAFAEKYGALGDKLAQSSDLGKQFQGRALQFAANLAGGLKNINKAADQLSSEAIFAETSKGLKAVDAELAKVRTSLGQYTTAVTDTSAAQALGNDELVKRRRLLQLEASTQQAAIEATQNQISKIDELNPKNQKNLNILKEGLAARQAELSQTQASIGILDKEFTARVLQGQAIGTVNERLETLSALRDQAASNSEAVQILAETEAYQGLVMGIINAQQAEAVRLGTKIGLIQSVLDLDLRQLQLLDEQREKNGELKTEEQARYDELSKNVAENTQKQAELYAQVKESIAAAFEKGIQDAQKFGDIAQQVASGIASAFSSIASASSSGLSQAVSTVSAVASALEAQIDKRTNERIKKLEESGLKGVELEKKKAEITKQADQQKKAIAIQELAFKRQMIDAEYVVESIRNRVQTSIAVNEARVAQLRLEAEAKIAEARGENDLARSLYQAADAQNVIIRGLQQEGYLNQRILNLRRDQQRASLAAEAAGKNIQGFDFPGIRAAVADGQDFANIAVGATKSLGRAAEAASNVAVNIESSGIEKAANSANDVAFAVSNAAEGAKRLATDSIATAKALSAAANRGQVLYRNLAAISGLGGGGVPQRALGGPVSAGSQYLVNDGGGREAFVSRSGKLSMLPPGRNLNWIAPSSGTIIPANMVNEVKAQFELNNRGKALNSKFGRSGNLITHASNVGSLSNSSSSQRIVNHVTIQSTSPVMDASKLMTQVAKAKARRRF